MEHPLIAIVAPLTELNPVKFALDARYRAAAGLRLGPRARRIFVYQVAMATLALVGLVLVFALFAAP